MFKSSPTTSNLIAYKKCNALFQKEMKESKGIYYEMFTSQVNKNTSIGAIWSKIHRLTNNNVSNQFLTIQTSDTVSTGSSLIANAFAKNWSEYSADNNFTDVF